MFHRAVHHPRLGLSLASISKQSLVAELSKHVFLVYAEASVVTPRHVIRCAAQLCAVQALTLSVG